MATNMNKAEAVLDMDNERIIDTINAVPLQQLIPYEEIKATLIRLKTLGQMSTALARPVCSQCELYDYNEMSGEAYCAAKDYKPIKLYRKHRPDWCPRLEK